MDSQDGIYARRPWTRNVPDVQRVNSSFEDMMTAAALDSQMNMDEDAIRAIQPPIPIDPFPAKFGYRIGALGIDDIVDLDDIYKRHDFTGRQSGYSGSSFPSLGHQ